VISGILYGQSNGCRRIFWGEFCAVLYVDWKLGEFKEVVVYVNRAAKKGCMGRAGRSFYIPSINHTAHNMYYVK